MQQQSTLTVLLVLGLAQTSTCVHWCDPWPDDCYICNTTDAHCVTKNRSEVIPQVLDKKLTLLVVYYEDLDGKTVQIERSMFKRYSKLEIIKLVGDISAITADSLETLPNLNLFCLEDTKISGLPDDLFRNNEALKQLVLTGNGFRTFPHQAFGNSSVIRLNRLHFSRNSQPVNLDCYNDTIVLPREFAKFVSLSVMDISFNYFTHSNCSLTVRDSFFHSVSSLINLDVSGTNLLELHGGDLIFKNLNETEELALNNMSPYRLCPSNATRLFENLPRNLQTLYVGHWESFDDLDIGCLFTNTTLIGLTNLPKLKYLSFEYSDQAFGAKLTKESLPPLPNLQILNLGYCRFSSINEDTFVSYSSMKVLLIRGNPLGSKNYSMAVSTNLMNLSLAQANLLSGQSFDYSGSELFCSYPNLKVIDLSNNFMHKMPIFSGKSSCRFSWSGQFQTMLLMNNSLKSFSENDASNICLAFPMLETLSLRDNQIDEIDGLEKCNYLRHLSLARNHLWYDDNHNMTVVTLILKQLTKLESLDLSSNGLRAINGDILSTMQKLQKFSIRENAIEYLSPHFFKNNLNIRSIDLSWNFIEAITVSMFENLEELELVNLQGNLIASLSQEFLHMIDQKPGFITIGNNPYDCGCDKYYFHNWVRSTRSLFPADLRFIKCSSPTKFAHKLVYQYERDLFNCLYKEVIIIIGCTLGSIFIAVLLYKYRWYVSHIRIVWRAMVKSAHNTRFDHLCLYDAYISFDSRSEVDSHWVMEELVAAIEGKGMHDEECYRLYIDARDAGCGTSRFIERAEVLQLSRKIIVVVSNSYLKSAQCLAEADITAYERHGTKLYQPDRVLILITEELSEEVIREPMRSLLDGNVLQATAHEMKKKRSLWRKVRNFLARPGYLTTIGDGSSGRLYSTGEDSAETTPLMA